MQNAILKLIFFLVSAYFHKSIARKKILLLHVLKLCPDSYDLFRAYERIYCDHLYDTA